MTAETTPEDTFDDGTSTPALEPAGAEGRRRLLAVAFAAAAISVVALVAIVDNRIEPLGLVVVLLIAQAINCAAAFVLQPRAASDYWPVGDAVFVCGLGLLSPLGLVTVFAVGTSLGLLVGRQRPVLVAFNGALTTLSAAGGLALAGTIAPAQSPESLRLIAALLVGVVVYTIVNELIVGIWTRVVYGRPAWADCVRNLGRAARSPWIASIGLLAALAGRASPWAIALAVPPLAAYQILVSERLKARRDRERTLGLFAAATEAHASVRIEEVRDAFTQAAARLLQCGHAEIRNQPPGRGEWGVRLAVGGPDERWLVVRERHSGDPLDVDDQRLLETIGAVGSSALENARLVEEIRHQAVHDSLTELPNQLLFDDRVERAITSASQRSRRFAVAVLDLDAFKKINDSLGHSAGNTLLQLIAGRLHESVGPLDTVARLGGDHFTILLPDVDNPHAAGTVAERLLAAVRQAIWVGGQELFMTASLGIAFYPEDGTKPEHLLRNANAAMHRAKDLGRGGYQIYAASMNALAHLRLALESELHNAVERGEFTLRYQPQVDLRTERVVGLEALIRWNHPVLGLVGPGEFVPIAEESGFIIEVDLWVLEEACRQGQAWLSEGLPSVRLSVNLSGRHFQMPGRIVGSVCAVLASTGFDPAHLELEVTEGVAVSESEEVIRALEELRALGMSVAIDDFGTGYSMLGRLQRFPVDRLKIDRSFVSEISSGDAQAPLVVAIIAMARSLHLETVAEGVETQAQLDFLRNKGCDLAQGYLFCEPRDPDSIARLLETPASGVDISQPA